MLRQEFQIQFRVDGEPGEEANDPFTRHGAGGGVEGVEALAGLPGVRSRCDEASLGVFEHKGNDARDFLHLIRAHAERGDGGSTKAQAAGDERVGLGGSSYLEVIPN